LVIILCWEEKLAKVFNLISSVLSPDPPPVEGSGFEQANDSLQKDNKLPFKLGLLFKEIEDILLIVCERTFDCIPPPVK